MGPDVPSHMATYRCTGKEVAVKSLRFITFEGGEGGGKSTQVRFLKERIEQLGHEVVVTREPGGSPRGERIREFILSGQGKPFGAFAEAILFSAARIDHLRETIIPALERGAFVICDRFADSTRAYQGVVGDVPTETIAALEQVAVGEYHPTLTIILDLSPETGLARAQARREEAGEEVDRFEGEDLEFHRKLRQAFLQIAENEPERCCVVSTEQPKEATAEEIWRIVSERFLPKDSPSDEHMREMEGADGQG